MILVRRVMPERLHPQYRSGVAPRYPYLEGDGVIAFAHRGGTSSHPENTMESFAAAVALGYRYLETDVHASRDDVLFAFHDDDLSRVAGVQGRIGDLTAAEIDAIRFDGEYRIPRFAELMATWPQARLNIDPKADAAVDPLIAEIRAMGAIDRVCIGAFSDARIKRCRDRLGPGLCTSMGPIEVLRLVAISWGLPVGAPVAPCVQIPIGFDLPVPGLDVQVRVTTERLIATAAELDIDVHVWTIDDPDEMNRLIGMGVDGIMTDEPARLRSVLVERGLWTRHAL